MTDTRLKSHKSIGELVHYFRLVKGYSQKELADRLYVTVSAVSSWERGHNKPALDVALKISKDMGMTLDEFYLYRRPNEHNGVHQLSDVITFEHTYVTITEIQMNLDENTLSLTLQLTGISITRDIVEFYGQQSQILVDHKSVKVEHRIEQRPDKTMHISPEFEATTIKVPVFDCHITFPYKPYQSIAIELHCQEHKETFVIPALVIRLLHEGESLLTKNSTEAHAFLTSDAHQEVLRFLAKSTNPISLQQYLIQLYEA